MTKLETRLKQALLSFTDKICYFPCRGDRPQVEYPAYNHWHYKIKGTDKYTDTLYIACAGKTPFQIMEAVYEGLTGNKKRFNKISDNNKWLLSCTYENNLDWIKRNQRRPRWEQERIY